MKKLNLITLSILTLPVFAADYVVIVNEKNNDYEVGGFSDETITGEWFKVGEENCEFDIERESIYYGKTFDQTETCDEKQERTVKIVRTYDNGTTEETLMDNEERSLIDNIVKDPVSTYGLHLEASCKDALAFDNTLVTQRYTIQTPTQGNVRVTCDMDTDGGGWTVIQYRTSFYDFYRGWTEYEDGFGTSTNFWLGNKYIHDLTTSPKELYVYLEDSDGTSVYAKYSSFSVADYSTKYQLSISGYSGTAGDSLTAHDAHVFSTKDQDNDNYEHTNPDYSTNCAVRFKGAWWYGSCHRSNLNAYYYNGAHTSYADGVNWYDWKGHYYSIPKTKMMIR